jgi:hypothetical protein
MKWVHSYKLDALLLGCLCVVAIYYFLQWR